MFPSTGFILLVAGWNFTQGLYYDKFILLVSGWNFIQGFYCDKFTVYSNGIKSVECSEE
jgi:hypothetical protein